MVNCIRHIVILCLLSILVSCAETGDNEVVYSPEENPQNTDGSATDGDDGSDNVFVRQRILVDMLYEARVAYEDNRLMTPPGNNAYDGFRSVLDFDPENEVALQGIRDVALRYVELAEAAIQLRQYDNAEDLLNRAARVDSSQPAIADSRRRLEQAREIEMDVFSLDAESLSQRNLEIMVELGEIGQYIRDREATFLINARTDEEGRWIYQTMRQAVGGYRLRGNIAMDNEPSIQVVVPKS